MEMGADPHGSDESALDRVLRTYQTWLDITSQGHAEAFRRRVRDARDAAVAEAVAFSVLRLRRANPRPGEHLATGGVDFLCETGKGYKFAVEVTTIDSGAVTRASGLAAGGSVNATGSFAMLTMQLKQRIANKAPQMSGLTMPRLLIIASTHGEASMVMGADAAKFLLVGTPHFSVPIGDVETTPEVATSLRDSAFARFDANGNVEPARQSVSAVLLMTISDGGASLIGLLHPAPVHVFDHQVFESVHFCRLQEWPPVKRLAIEWVGPEPSTTAFPLWPIEFTTEELVNPK